jgi:hypothetical protein
MRVFWIVEKDRICIFCKALIWVIEYDKVGSSEAAESVSDVDKAGVVGETGRTAVFLKFPPTRGGKESFLGGMMKANRLREAAEAVGRCIYKSLTD